MLLLYDMNLLECYPNIGLLLQIGYKLYNSNVWSLIKLVCNKPSYSLHTYKNVPVAFFPCILSISSSCNIFLYKTIHLQPCVAQTVSPLSSQVPTNFFYFFRPLLLGVFTHNSRLTSLKYPTLDSLLRWHMAAMYNY